jgi:hypothetical protein
MEEPWGGRATWRRSIGEAHLEKARVAEAIGRGGPN